MQAWKFITNSKFMLKENKYILILNQNKLIFQKRSQPLYEMLSSLQLETIPGAWDGPDWMDKREGFAEESMNFSWQKNVTYALGLERQHKRYIKVSIWKAAR